MLIALNSAIRRHRGHLGAALLVIALAGAVAVTHSALGSGHMAPASHHVSMGVDGSDIGISDVNAAHDMVVMCLAVTETVALGFALFALVSAMLCALCITVTALQPALAVAAAQRPPGPSARAGPAVLQVFLR